MRQVGQLPRIMCLHVRFQPHSKPMAFHYKTQLTQFREIKAFFVQKYTAQLVRIKRGEFIAETVSGTAVV